MSKYYEYLIKKKIKELEKIDSKYRYYYEYMPEYKYYSFNYITEYDNKSLICVAEDDYSLYHYIYVYVEGVERGKEMMKHE